MRRPGSLVVLRARQSREPLADLLPEDIQDRGALAERLARFDDARDRDLRGREHRFLVESERCVRRFLRSRAWPCEALLLTAECHASLAAIIDLCGSDAAVFIADDQTMTSISGYRLHGGALAIGVRGWRPPSADTLIEKTAEGIPTLVVMAEGVSQVDNVGGLFRGAACFGASAIVLDDACADPLLRKTIRFSTGRVFDVPWGISRDLVAASQALRARGVTVVGLEIDDRAVPLRDLRADGKAAIIVGNEARGISRRMLDACDVVASIPSLPPDEDGQARSLNVAVAASIAMYELRSRTR